MIPTVSGFAEKRWTMAMARSEYLTIPFFRTDSSQGLGNANHKLVHPFGKPIYLKRLGHWSANDIPMPDIVRRLALVNAPSVTAPAALLPSARVGLSIVDDYLVASLTGSAFVGTVDEEYEHAMYLASHPGWNTLRQIKSARPLRGEDVITHVPALVLPVAPFMSTALQNNLSALVDLEPRPRAELLISAGVIGNNTRSYRLGALYLVLDENYWFPAIVWVGVADGSAAILNSWGMSFDQGGLRSVGPEVNAV